MQLSRRMYGLVALAGLAFLIRAAVVVWLAFAGDTPYTYEHGVIAENLLAGDGFSIRFLGVEGPTSQQGPLYPTALAALYALFGVGSRAALVTMQLLQCAAGAGLVVALAQLVWALVPQRPAAGWMAVVAATLFPTHIYMVTHIQIVVWAATLLVVLLAVVATPQVSRPRLRAALAGALAGILILTEPIMALAVPVAALLLLRVEWKRPQQGRISRPAVVAVTVMTFTAIFVVAPWVLRNRAVHGEWVFVKSTFGYAFWQGNNPRSWGTDKLPSEAALRMVESHDGSLAARHQALREARLKTQYIDDVVLADEGYEQFQGLTEPQRCRVLSARARAFITEHPGRYLALCWQRLRYFLLLDETNPKTHTPAYQVATVSWFVVACVGLLVSLGQWRRLWPIYAIFAAVTLFHTLTITSVRFRIAVEPLSLVWIAVAFEPLLVHLRSPVRWLAGLRTPQAQPQPATHPKLAGPHFLRRGRESKVAASDDQSLASQRDFDLS